MKYDFVVVGSGCAGLSAACELAKNGKKVLLIEKHNIPGGCASGFTRGRFEFDPSLHELCGVGSPENPGNVRNLFDSYGVKLDWCEVPDCFRIVSVYSDGTPMDVTMPAGAEAFIEKMEYYVPGSLDKMRHLFDVLSEIEQGLAESSHLSGPELSKLYPAMLTAGSYCCMDVFKALELPQKCIDILSTYWSYLGVDMEHLSFLHYASMVNSYVRLSAYIPKHTSHEISVALLEAFKKMGGEAWFNCRADKFIFDGKKCIGVETSMGKVFCDCVIANINPDIIYGKMMPPSAVPKREVKLSNARNRRFGARMFTCYMGLNKTAEELGIKDYSIFMASTSDSVKEYESLKSIKTNEYSIFLCYDIANPGFSPEGTCTCSFTTMFASSDDWDNIDITKYPALKDKIAKSFIDNLKKKTGIDIAPYIEEISIASPLTFARYLGTPEGSVYGYETRDWDDIITRTMSMASDYTIDGLIPVGTSGVRGDGYSSAYADGNILADYALKKMGGNK